MASDPFDALRLPFLVFSSSLQLVRANSAAQKLFAHPPPSGSRLPTASWFFRSEEYSANDDEALPAAGAATATSIHQSPLRSELDVLVKEGQLAGWGESSTIVYWTGPLGAREAHRAEVLVCPLPDAPPLISTRGATFAEAFTVTFLRPVVVKGDPSLSTPLSSSPLSWSHLNPSGSSQQLGGEGERTASQLEEILLTYVDKTTPIKDLREYKEIVDEIPQIIFSANKNGQVEYLNREWYTYTGLEFDGSFDMATWTDRFHPDDLPTALEAFGVSMQTGNPIDMEYRVRAASGDWRRHVARGIALRDDVGAVRGWVASLTEVEELVRVRSDALRIRSHVTAVLAGAAIVLFSVDLSGMVTFFEGNREKLEVGPPSPDPFVGKALSVVWSEPKLLAAVERVISEGMDSLILLTEIQLPDARGSHWYRYRLVPLSSEHGTITGVIIVAANATDLVEAEQALQRSNHDRSLAIASETAAKEASRLKSEFLTTMSHEIRTPITAMMGISELLLDDATLQPEHRTLVEQCLRCGEILLSLVGTILDLGKIEANQLALERHPLKLSDLLQDANLFSFNARKQGITFAQEIEGVLYDGYLLGDRLRIQQIIGNALSNSIKFTDDGGVTFRVQQAEDTSSRVLLTFEVEDTGCGIDEAALPRLFTPFRQAGSSTQRRYGGTGLGLVIAKSLAQMMGGTVTLSSVLGKGTLLKICIPFEKAPISESNTDLSVTAAETSRRTDVLYRRREEIRILLAEDNDLVREILTRTLKRKGFQVVGVTDGEAAVVAAETSNFDCILMDGQMPRLDGYEATKRIRNSLIPSARNVKIIALTASAIQGDRERYLSVGMNGFLTKPVRNIALEEAIVDALGVVPE